MRLSLNLVTCPGNNLEKYTKVICWPFERISTKPVECLINAASARTEAFGNRLDAAECADAITFRSIGSASGFERRAAGP